MANRATPDQYTAYALRKMILARAPDVVDAHFNFALGKPNYENPMANQPAIERLYRMVTPIIRLEDDRIEKMENFKLEDPEQMLLNIYREWAVGLMTSEEARPAVQMLSSIIESKQSRELLAQLVNQ